MILFISRLSILIAKYVEANHYFVDPDKLYFRHQNLTEVPSDLSTILEEDSKNVTKALFSHNKFNVLKRDDLKRLLQFPNLKYVFFDSNNINNVEAGALAQLPNLKFLELSHNSLTEISDALYDDLKRLNSLKYINLKRNPINNYKNIDKLVLRGVQIEYDGVSGRERKMRMRSRSVVSDGSANDEAPPVDLEDEGLRIKDEEEIDNHLNEDKEEIYKHLNEDEDHSNEDEDHSERIHDKPVKAFVIDPKLEHAGQTGPFKVNNNFLGSIIFNFLAAFLVLVALPIAMVVYYLLHRKDAIS